MRRLPLISLLLSVVACAGSDPEAGPSAASGASGGGKADGFGDEVVCPAEVALNAGEGSAKRCFDPSNGQFVATGCCADVCEGAAMREQSNGERCAWTGEPGLEGASLGQFAPQLCCDLNAELACGRATQSDGVCTDPETGAEVDAACCAVEPEGCHPSIAAVLNECVYAQAEGYHELGLPLPTRPTMFENCVNELELVAGGIDQRCAFQPDLPFCGLDFDRIANDYIAVCADSGREAANCTFGLTYFDAQAQAHIAVVHRAQHTLSSGQAAPAMEQAQIVAAVGGVHEQAMDLAGAFEVVDEGFVNVVELFDLSASVGYTAIEFGAGDNSYGAIFRSGTTQRAAFIGDGDIYDCEAPVGPGGNTCADNADCAAGFGCEGRIDDENPLGSPLGLCVNTEAPASFDSCTEIRGCDAGYCAGLIGMDGVGMCSPGWMFGERSNEEVLSVDGGSVRSDVLVYGQATVPMDLELTLDLFHDVDVRDLRVELLIPGYEGSPDDDRPRVTVWPREGVSAGHPTGGRVVLPVRAFSDESINGAWTLHVTDETADGASGGVFGWTLNYSSRYD